ncbi:hypothetical protein BO70DRAFT_425437 [Aspergillus heteromorphus CBS 117.55]|uniref:Uncharacterized protein n=1 Tax=Aspergillus heteromorphus CBS 117.55 TaxID=1448321 RepID=A0A317X867_9EURO|nr:uncharacterized protein BO70DRAFT_425437 [Aspergillus heteromorphus CBS 117.55]PWY92770.1 hypothetical protein BO70DRAFT_425437 [Aspergillus heteromorphus CBS 117.55]
MSMLPPAVHRRIEEWMSNCHYENPRSRVLVSHPPKPAPLSLAALRQLDQAIEQPAPLPENEHRGYERRPRHKTKEDRYEYKVRKGPGKGERVSKRGTKVTNDNFHAANVPCDRLTLNPKHARGIFNKGKASPPIRALPTETPDLVGFSTSWNSYAGPRRLPDPGFSERCFLRGSEASAPNENDSVDESMEGGVGCNYPGFHARSAADPVVDYLYSEDWGARGGVSSGQWQETGAPTYEELATGFDKPRQRVERQDEAVRAAAATYRPPVVSSGQGWRQDETPKASAAACRSSKLPPNPAPGLFKFHSRTTDSKPRQTQADNMGEDASFQRRTAPERNSPCSEVQPQNYPTYAIQAHTQQVDEAAPGKNLSFPEQEVRPDRSGLLSPNPGWQSNPVLERESHNSVENRCRDMDLSDGEWDFAKSDCYSPLSQIDAKSDSSMSSFLFVDNTRQHQASQMSHTSPTLNVGTPQHEDRYYSLGIEDILSEMPYAPNPSVVSDTGAYTEDCLKDLEAAIYGHETLASPQGTMQGVMNLAADQMYPNSREHACGGHSQQAQELTAEPAPANFSSTPWLETRVRGLYRDRANTAGWDTDINDSLGEFWQPRRLY